jgi:hypothetical protein
MLWAIIQANPILSETTDCTQSTGYLYTKRDCSLIWTALAENAQDAVLGVLTYSELSSTDTPRKNPEPPDQ